MNCLRLLRTVRSQPLLNISTVKYISQHPLKFLETQEWWKEKDDVPQRWQLIYKAPMVNILNYASAYLTFSTVTVACSSLYYAAFLFDEKTINDPIVVGDDIVIANTATEGLIYLGAFIAFHVAVKILLSKYVIRLYKDGDDYLAVFRGNWYNSVVKHEFHLKEFKKLNPSLVITWSEARFALGKKKGILLENYFKTPEHFNYLLTKKRLDSNEDETN
ncbi:uncharacterized protein [Epargyreus clarus]|uniref:uncharacterized protein n=1 Tax=Epargyreus clarus TaxID=520877 RepID=UPI003C2F1DE7